MGGRVRTSKYEFWEGHDSSGTIPYDCIYVNPENASQSAATESKQTRGCLGTRGQKGRDDEKTKGLGHRGEWRRCPLSDGGDVFAGARVPRK